MLIGLKTRALRLRTEGYSSSSRFRGRLSTSSDSAYHWSFGLDPWFCEMGRRGSRNERTKGSRSVPGQRVWSQGRACCTRYYRRRYRHPQDQGLYNQ